MNDQELDELLNSWKAPKPGEALRESIRGGIEAQRARPPRNLFTRWRLAAVAAVVILAVVVAYPTAFLARSNPPYTVESKIVHDAGWESRGGPPWHVAAPLETPVMTSYNENGSEVILSWSSPDHPVQAALWKARLAVSGMADSLIDCFLSIAQRFHPRFIRPADEDADAFAVVYPHNASDSLTIGRRAELVSSDCRPSFRGWEVLSPDVILSYPTTVVREGPGGDRRITLWMAPELSCFALRATIETKQRDGTWRIVSERKAVKITVNR